MPVVSFDPDKCDASYSTEARIVLAAGYKAVPIKRIMFNPITGRAQEVETIRIVSDAAQPRAS